MTIEYDDTCSSCKKGYNFQPETALNLYLGYLRATNISATCPHCQTEQFIFLAYASIMRFSEHEAVKVLVFYHPVPDIAERADKVWERGTTRTRSCPRFRVSGPEPSMMISENLGESHSTKVLPDGLKMAGLTLVYNQTNNRGPIPCF